MIKLKKILCLLLMGVCVGAMLLSGCGKEKENEGDSEKKNESDSEKENEDDPLKKEGYVLDWHDEFDGTELDTEKWLPLHQPHRSSDSEAPKARYTIENGALKLRIDEDTVNFYDGSKGGFRISSIQTYEKNGLHIGETVTTVTPFNGYTTQYGYFELRCKMPSCGGGGAVAWWMVGAENDADEAGEGSEQDVEIDIIETLYSKPNEAVPKVHPWNDRDMSEWSDTVQLEGDYVNEYHTYAMDWTPESLVFYVDGKEIARTNQSPQYEMCMYLSMYANDDPNYWAGGASNDIYPKEWEIDYVRVYKDENGYPNGQTKPSGSSDIVKVYSETYRATADPVEHFGITDLARQAKVTTTAESSDSTSASLQNITRPGFEGTFGWSSKNDPELPAEFVFTWDTPQNVDTVDMYTFFAVGQGITKVELQIQKEGGEWTRAGEYEIEWLLNTNTKEYARMAVPDGEGITGLKMIVKDANLEWDHYSLLRVHIYKGNN